jgi:hypothetical protein
MWYCWRMRDEVDKLEQQYVGDLVRLEIPLKSVMNLRKVAEVLRGLAARLDTLGRYSDYEPASVMLEVGKLTRRANKELTAIRGRGRPKKSRNTF